MRVNTHTYNITSCVHTVLHTAVPCTVPGIHAIHIVHIHTVHHANRGGDVVINERQRAASPPATTNDNAHAATRKAKKYQTVWLAVIEGGGSYSY